MLQGVISALNSAKATMAKIPTWLQDPQIVVLLAEKELTKAANAVALKFLETAEGAVAWCPIELDPRVAYQIVLKGTAELGQFAAKEALQFLQVVVDNFKVDQHPKGELKQLFFCFVLSHSTRFFSNVKSNNSLILLIHTKLWRNTQR